MKRGNTIKWMTAAAFAGVVLSSQAALIGSESFKATVAVDDYTGDTSVGDISNRSILVGNTGFGAYDWLNNTGAISPNAWAGMVHSGVTGSTLAGNLHVQPQASINRNSARYLDTTMPTASSYYLSSLVRLGALANLRDGQDLSIGFLGNLPAYNAYDINTGMHIGVRRTSGVAYLTASAGGQTWDLTSIAGKEADVFQVVLKLDANASGTDTLTAWYAEDGDSALTQGLAPTSVETWSAEGDLMRMIAQEKSTYNYNPFGARFDEVRLGTELADVTTIPEPATLGLIALSGGVLFMTRRLRV